MINFVPLFPLNIVVYPHENLNLHIFEEKYLQLINDKIPFGILTCIDNKQTGFGTLVEVVDIVKVHPNKTMDIKTKALKVFALLELIKEVPEKLYCGGIVSYPENREYVDKKMIVRVMKEVKELHQLLGVNKDFKKNDNELTSYDIAHHVGLSLQEESELLELMHEEQRLEFIRRHLAKTIKVLSAIEGLRQRIKLNGHFKEAKGFDLR